MKPGTRFRGPLSSAVSSRHPLDKGLPSAILKPFLCGHLWYGVGLGRCKVPQLRVLFSLIGYPRALADPTKEPGCEAVRWPVPLTCVCRRNDFCGHSSFISARVANDSELLRYIFLTDALAWEKPGHSPQLCKPRASKVSLCTSPAASAPQVLVKFSSMQVITSFS